MPYSGADDSDLPSNVKKLSDKKRRQWVHIWNSTYSSCTKGGGGQQECESKAFRVANGVIKKGERMQDESFLSMFKEWVKGVFDSREDQMTEKDLLSAIAERENIPLSIRSRSMVQRQADGRYRIFSVSAVATKNRVGEIDSRDLFDSFISIARATGKYPQRDFMHMGRAGDIFITGDVDYVERSGNVLITSTLYRDTELARAEVAARMANPEDWGDSIAYIPLGEGSVEEDQVWVSPGLGYLNFVSTVPERLAASHFTAGTILEEVDRMSLKGEKLEAFIALFGGDEQRASQWLDENVGDVEKLIQDSGMMTRSVEEEPEEPPQEQPEPEDREFEIDDDFIQVIVERTAGVLNAQLDEIVASIAALKQDLEQLLGQTDQRHAEVTARLNTLELDEREKLQLLSDDMPRKQRVSVTYRPRENSGDESPTFDEQAREVVEGWADVHTYYGSE